MEAMTTEDSSPSPRYATLGDYLRVLRGHWIMIALVALVGAGAGFAQASNQTATYQATAEVGFQDPTQQLSIVGLGSSFVQSAGQLASVNQQLATSPSVMEQVKRRLGTSLSARTLGNAISTQVVPASSLLEITGTTTSPIFAASLANAVGRTLVAQDNVQARAQFSGLASNVRRRIAALNARARKGRASVTGQLAFYEDELARLETVAAFAKTAQIVTPAQIPTGSTSDRTRSTILGFILGLLVGIFAAFLHASTDRRLRTQEDMRISFGLPLLGRVRNESMGRIAHMTPDAGEASPTDLEAFRILRRNLEFLDRESPSRRILVTSAAPAEGKTTVASSLAFALAAAGKRTLLVDCDLRRSTLSKRLGVEQTPGITDYLGGAAAPEEVLRTLEVMQPTVGETPEPSSNGHAADIAGALVFIPSGSSTPRAAELLGSGRFDSFLAEASEIYDVVVLDSSPLLPVSDTLEILPHVDAIILCARDSQTTRDQASAAKAALARFPERPTGLVVTGIKPRDEYEFYSYSYDYN